MNSTDAFDEIMTELVAYMSMLRQLGFAVDQIEFGVSVNPTQLGLVLVIVVANGKKFVNSVGAWLGSSAEFERRAKASIQTVISGTAEQKAAWQVRINRSGTLRDYDTIVAKLQKAGLLGA